jgi:vacuolar protein sorting-associated protein 13A/C
MTVELDEDFLFALLDFVKFKDAAWKEPVPEYVSSLAYQVIMLTS